MKSVLKKSWPLWPFVVVVLAGIGGGVWYWYSQREPSSLPATPAYTKSSQDAPVAELVPVDALPPPEESDAVFRKQLAKISSNPNVAAWLRKADLVRLLSSVIRAVAKGETPRTILGFLAPTEGLKIVKRDGRMYIDRASFQRYDTVAKAIASLDVEACSTAYTALRPLLESAYREIGEPKTTFEPILAQAIKRLVNTPVPGEEIEVRFGEKSAMYEFNDPLLEALSPAQKHLLRMGPRNMKLVQDKLREIESALNFAQNAPK